jgi:hypothetical protein
MHPVVRTEAGLRAHQSRARDATFSEEIEYLAIEKIVSGAGILVEVDRHFPGQARREHECVSFAQAVSRAFRVFNTDRAVFCLKNS